jgi:arylsulfatase A-like enzyme
MVHTQGVHSPYYSPCAWNVHRDEESSRRAAYLNLVEFVDAQLGRFLDRLPKDAVVIVTSDHGEALGEAGEWGHGGDDTDVLYDVPLIIAGASPPFAQHETVTHIEVHEWLRGVVAKTREERARSAELQERLEALGYADGTHSV